jgi:hypothetical protein
MKEKYKYSKEFKEYAKLMQEGLVIGQKKYGDNGIVNNSQIQMMEEEIRDFSTYGFLLYVKLQFFKKQFLKLKDFKEVTGVESKDSFRRTHKGT